jgi:predicted nucleic acid-binding protein
MNGNRFVFDTCAVIKLLGGEYGESSIAANIDFDEARLFTSVLVRMELLAKPDLRFEDEQKILDFLNDIVVIPLGYSVEKTAVAIRRATKLKLPDCVVAATAVCLDATLLTYDEHLLNLSWPSFKALNIF